MLLRLAAFALLSLSLLTAAQAQGFAEYVNREEGFAVSLPGAPAIEKFTYTTEYDSKVPATRYTSANRTTRYTVTVVDMRTTDREPARQGIEIRGAIQFAATTLRRTGTVTLDSYHELEGVPVCHLSAAHRPDLTMAVSEKRRQTAGDRNGSEETEVP